MALPPLLSGPKDKDQALQQALTSLAASRGPAGEDQVEAGRRLPAEVPYDAVVTAVHRLAPRQAVLAPFPDGLDPRLTMALAARGIEQPYTHQAEAMAHALGGRNVVVVTPTASGKTLCYNAPVLTTVLRDPSARALYLFPTKALAQDQLAELSALCDALAAAADRQIGVFTYDGDTPQDARRAIRSRAHVVLSNPDMLHSGILPHHPRWAKLFENLRFIVVDELHAYRGVFGSHLANILRRLQRVCRHYGSDPVFICSSATIANPRELAEGLTGRPFELVESSGAPRGEKFFVFVNPPVVNSQLGIRRSYLAQARRVALEFLKRGLQVIVFAQSRLATEILTTYLKDALAPGPGGEDLVRGYRGGYLPNRRREIERGLREGRVRAVVSTSALELGIDIGALDVAVLAGYPGTIAATWQRAGRAGRRAARSAAILVASSAPLDQFVIRNPSYFFGASPEHALINPDNLHILLDHVKCAAFELPFAPDETFGREDVQQVLGLLAEEGFVHAAEDGWHWTSESYPADAVSLRSVSSDNFVVVDSTREPLIVGEVDFTSATSTLHEKAIYIVEGKLYQVERLDFEGRKAYVREVDCDYYTDAITYTKVTILETFAADAGVGDAEDAPVSWDDLEGRVGPGPVTGADDALAVPAEFAGPGLPPRAGPAEADEGAGAGDGLDDALAVPAEFVGPGLQPRAGPAEADVPVRSHGEVHVVSRVVGFKKIKFYTNENVGSGELDLPEQQMHTTAYWLTVPRDLMASLPYGGEDRRDGVAGLAFALRNVAQLLLMCDRQDIGIAIGSTDVAGTLGGPRGAVPDAVPFEPQVFVYDNYPGGIGFSEPLFTMHGRLLARTRDLVVGCPCESGCPSCVGPIGETGPLAKSVASRLLAALLGEVR